MRLLISEGNRILSKSLISVLERNNFPSDSVFDYATTLEYVNSELYDGLILDTNVCQNQIIALISQIRASKIYIPILVLSDNLTVDMKISILDAGVDDILIQPFELRELSAHVRAMLRRHKTFLPNVLEYNGISLNRSNYQLSYNDNSVYLTGREYQISEMLFYTSGNIITTEQIIQKVWGLDSDIDNDVIWVYISKLRSKLGHLGAPATIKGLRGVGYTLIHPE